MLTVFARVRQRPPDHRGYDLAVDEVSAPGATYEEAVAAVERLVPEDWQVISLRVDRGDPPG